MAGPSIHDIWVAKQMKLQLIIEKEFIYNERPLQLNKDLWQIICDFWLEDPRIVNKILYSNAIKINGTSFIINLLCLTPNPSHFHTHLLALDIALGGWYSNRYDGYRIYEKLLLMPIMQLDTTEVSAQQENGIYEMRDALYKTLL